MQEGKRAERVEKELETGAIKRKSERVLTSSIGSD